MYSTYSIVSNVEYVKYSKWYTEVMYSKYIQYVKYSKW